MLCLKGQKVVGPWSANCFITRDFQQAKMHVEYLVLGGFPRSQNVSLFSTMLILVCPESELCIWTPPLHIQDLVPDTHYFSHHSLHKLNFVNNTYIC